MLLKVPHQIKNEKIIQTIIDIFQTVIPHSGYSKLVCTPETRISIPTCSRDDGTTSKGVNNNVGLYDSGVGSR